MKTTLFATAILTLILSGCSDAAKARAEAEKAKAEAEKTKTDLELAKLKGNEKKSAELKWARSFAEDFVRALKANDLKAADELLAPEYRDRLTEKERKEGTVAFNLFMGDKSTNSWSITGEELSPNGTEAKFTGEFGTPAIVGETRYINSFTVLMTRGKESDLWRVNLFTVAKNVKKK